MNLAEAKLQQLDAASTYRIYGHPVDFDDRPQKGGPDRARRWFPIQPCFCVHDSPTSPCPCMDEHVWWLPGDLLLAQGTADREANDGKDLQFFDVATDATIMVETVQPVRVGALKDLGDTVSPQTVRELAAGSSGVMYAASKPVPWKDIPALIRDVLVGLGIDAIYDAITDPIDFDKLEEWAKGKGKGKGKGKPS